MNYLSAGYDPPAAVAIVVLRNTSNSARLADIPMLLDTGAEISIIPSSALLTLGVTLTPDPTFKLLSYDGTPSPAVVAVAGIELCGRLFQGRYIALDMDVGIIGRDILNEIHLTLDGPALRWSITQTP